MSETGIEIALSNAEAAADQIGELSSRDSSVSSAASACDSWAGYRDNVEDTCRERGIPVTPEILDTFDNTFERLSGLDINAMVAKRYAPATS